MQNEINIIIIILASLSVVDVWIFKFMFDNGKDSIIDFKPLNCEQCLLFWVAICLISIFTINEGFKTINLIYLTMPLLAQIKNKML